MNTYEFTLRFALPSSDSDMDDIADRLYGGGCDDALIGIGWPGSVALDFSRASTSAHTAVMSAIGDVIAAIPGSELVEVAPDLVGATEVADLVGRSRQNIRQLMLASGGPIPVPIHMGKQSLWHLAHVLEWLARDKHYRISACLVELAVTSMHINAAVGSLHADSETEEELRAMLA